jgi:hypothetical protein
MPPTRSHDRLSPRAGRPLLAGAGLLLLLPLTAAAQRAPVPSHVTPRLAEAIAATASPATRPSPNPSVRPTYWKEGALVGALLGGTVGALGGAAICGQADEPGKDCTGSTILGGVVGGVLLAIPGALVGGLFPKAPR